MNLRKFFVKNVICASLPTAIEDLGEFIDHDHAYSRLQDYLTAVGPPASDPKFVFGQIFGLNNLKTLMSAIDAYNSNAANTNKIAGLRIYNAVDVRPYLNPPDNTKLLPDAIIVPVLDDNTDISHVRQQTDVLAATDGSGGTIPNVVPANMILSGGMPCPNECQ